MVRPFLLAALACSCVPAQPARVSMSPGACADVAPSGDPRADVDALAERCAAGLSRARGEASGTQGESDPSARMTLEVRGGRRCFRIVAAGDAGVTELDVQVLDPSGRPLARDARHGRLAVIPEPESGLLCLPAGGPYVIEIAVTGGRGAFLLRAFSGA